jgi:hypothetical protein
MPNKTMQTNPAPWRCPAQVIGSPKGGPSSGKAASIQPIAKPVRRVPATRLDLGCRNWLRRLLKNTNSKPEYREVNDLRPADRP